MRLVFRRSGFARLACLAAAIVFAAACATPPEEYGVQIAAARAQKDVEFATSGDSPIPAGKRDVLLPLAYFPIDDAYAVPAELELAGNRTRLQMPTSTGKLRDYERVGTLKFSVKGQPMRLTAFGEAGVPISRLFVPFADQTSGNETYDAGRYMELDPTATGFYLVDFNVAYHPYCYYSPEYDCPFPPAENRLAVPIRAGERLPDHAPASR
jgi:uncharacterized protein (DUF1684 family)